MTTHVEIPGSKSVRRLNGGFVCLLHHGKEINTMMVSDGETETVVCEDCFLEEAIIKGIDLGDVDEALPIEGEILPPAEHNTEETIWEEYCC